MKATYKVSHEASRGGPPVLRKLTLETASILDLIATVRERFQFDPSAHLELYYRDQDGDLITLSSDEELRELLASPDAQNGVVRLQVCETASRIPPASAAADADLPTNPDGPGPGPAPADDWLEIDSVEDEPLLAGFSTRVYTAQPGPPVEAEVEGPAAADPAEPVLPGSFASRLDALIDAEFPRVAVDPSATPTVAGSDSAAADPAEELLSPGDPPLDSDTVPSATTGGRRRDEEPAFSTLPGSFSSILSGLPSHAGSFSAQLATLVGSPESALGRLSAILTNPTGAVSSGAINLADLSSSLSNLGVDVDAAVHEVLQSVRSEAEGVRGEFERFRTEVEAEKTKFEAEVRAALEEAKRARAEAASARSTAGAEPVPETDTRAPAPADHASQDNAGRSAHGFGHGHGHAHREAKEARRSAREQRRHDKHAAATGPDRRCYESRYSWTPRDPSEPCYPGSGGWCRQPKSGGAPFGFAAKSGFGGGGGAASAATAASPPPPPPVVMRDAPYGMPGSMPFSTSGPKSPGWSAPAEDVPAADTPPATGAGGAGGNAFADPADGDKPVLLTAYLGAARLIGFDVDDANIRVALTDIWCSSSGRGMSAMLDQACEELFS
ncbi:hypothetical protein JCM3774_004686 [Rhodotorula dairenensis]